MILWFLLTVHRVFTQSIEFNDDLHYRISWNDPLEEKASNDGIDHRLVIMTRENEKYQCILPDDVDNGEDVGFVNQGASPEALLVPIVKKAADICSVRLEPYWTYKLCHGNKFLQYHEEGKTLMDGTTKLKHSNEFVLGRMLDDEVQAFVMKSKESGVAKEDQKVLYRRINDRNTPYFPIEMGHGTPCDLNGIPRKTTVLYICHPSSNNEILSVKEVTSCEYEVVVLSPSLCQNPNYRVKAKKIHDIKCHPLNGSPRQPLKVREMSPSPAERNPTLKVPTHTPKPTIVDKDLSEKFLNGDYCLTGGSGWWKYEFCNGKHISQFHVDSRSKTKTIIMLGFWNEEEHKKWRLHNKSTNLKYSITHFYSGGDVCDLTGKPRVAFVKLVCMRPTTSGSKQEIAISMSEDKPCRYSVTDTRD